MVRILVWSCSDLGHFEYCLRVFLCDRTELKDGVLEAEQRSLNLEDSLLSKLTIQRDPARTSFILDLISTKLFQDETPRVHNCENEFSF